MVGATGDPFRLPLFASEVDFQTAVKYLDTSYGWKQAGILLRRRWERLMQLIDIDVECPVCDGADEVPSRFCWDGLWIGVVEVLDRWHQRNHDPEWPNADYFKVLGTDDHQYLIKHDLEADTWYFGKRW